MATTKTIQEEMQDFLAKLPTWQRYLLWKIVTTPVVETNETAIAYKILLFESKLSSEPVEVPPFDFSALLATAAIKVQFTKLRLVSVKDFENVNAIRPKQLLTFGPQLTVVYGGNGSGKSGFARIFSNAFYSRGDRSILANVFGPKTNAQPKATFGFQDGEAAPYDLDLSTAKQRAEFAQFAVFDTKSVQVHVNGGNEIYVPPRELSYFEQLASFTITVGGLLDAEIEKKDKPNELSQLFDGNSPIKTAIQCLSAKSDLEKVKAQAQLNVEEIARITELDKELAKLKLQDVEKRKKELLALKLSLGTLKEQLSLIDDHFLVKPFASYQSAIEGHQKLQAAAEKSGLSQFTDPNFHGIGSPRWKQFLETAHAFATDQAAPYPHESKNCLLCKQSLSTEAVAVIEKYWTFLKGEEEKQLKSSQASLKRLADELKALNHQKLATDSALVLWLNLKTDGLVEKINEFLDCRRSEAKDLSSCIENINWSAFSPAKPFDTSLFATLEAQLDTEVSQLNADTIKATTEKLQSELTTLRHREKLAEHYASIELFVLNSRWLDLAREQRKKISTKAITDIHKKLHDELLNKKYIQLFHQECVNLSAPFQIDLEQKGAVGKTKRHLFVEGVQSGQILSEGEQRAIALADFFTEVEMSGIRSGIVFDDPVNSLDHVRKDIIAKRLVEAAKSRQVIVFTHDLSFLCDLRNATGEARVDLKGHWVDKHGGMENFETGIIHLDCPPISEADYVDPSEAEECLKAARDAANPKDRARRIKDGMSNLRTSYEAFILIDLFAGTVSRFDKQVNHSKFEKAFLPREYVELVCKKLKHLSGFIDGHLHSDHSSGANPLPDHLATEIREYQEMKGRFRLDRKTALSL